MPESLSSVKDAFHDYIMKIKRNDWFRDILRNQYYYEDVEEQDHIIELILSILEGNREDLAALVRVEYEEGEMKAAIEQVFLDKVSFSFDSFIKFRLKTYMQHLVAYVSISIDEYKMEQEYQMFIQTLRNFLAEREPKMRQLHVVFDEDITFYDEQAIRIQRSDLIKMIDRKLLVNHPIYVDSVSIAPLLSIAPEQIFLYCLDRDIPIIRTIENIFEERIVLRTISSFHDLHPTVYKEHTN